MAVLINPPSEAPLTMGRSAQLNHDTLGSDYIGLVNICLQASDTPLSGPSLTKALNIISNDVLRTVLIGHKPSVEEMGQGFEIYRAFLQESNMAMADGLTVADAVRY